MLARVANWFYFYFYSLFLLRLLPSSMQVTSTEAATWAEAATAAATLRNRPHALRLPLAFLNMCACVLARLRRANILPAFAIHTYVGGPEAAPPPEDTTPPRRHTHTPPPTLLY